jgi:uncharacterized protein YggE
MRFIVTLVVACLLAGICRAEDAPGAISVVGYGSVKGKPAIVEISVTISGEAELARDASVKQRDNRQRVQDAFDKLKDFSISIESKGFSVNQLVDPNMLALQQRAVQQLIVQNGVIVQQAPTAVDMAKKVSVSEQARVVLRDADKLDLPKLREAVLKLIDAARDGGVQLGQGSSSSVIQSQAITQPSIMYRITDTTSMRTEAYKGAIEDARKKATQLADLAGLKVGRIVAIREQDASANPSQSDPGLSSTTLGELTLNIGLTVQFEIVK